MRTNLLHGAYGKSTGMSVLLTVLGVIDMAGAAANAGIVNLTSQTRYVLITTDGAPISLPSETHREDATDFGPFNGSVTTAAFQQPLPGILQRVSQTSSMNMTTDGALIVDQSTINGSIQFNALPARSFFDVQFTLQSAEPFSLSFVGLYGDGRFIGQSGTIVDGSFTGPGAPGLLAPTDLHTYTRGDPLHYTGTLQPGTFDIQGDLNADANTGFLNLTLAIGPAAVGQAVPLPPAVQIVLPVLPLVVIAIHLVKCASRRRI